MRLIGRLLGTLVLALPAPAFAQTVTREALIGTWVGNFSAKPDSGSSSTVLDSLILQACGGFRKVEAYWASQGVFGVQRRWSLSGDTLRLYSENNTALPHERAGYLYKITLHDQQLTLDQVSEVHDGPFFSYAKEVYKRASVQLADLVGTWVGLTDTTATAAATTDTLIFRPDSTSNWSQGMEFSRWHHLTGDTISFTGGPGFKITLRDQKLILTFNNRGKWQGGSRFYKRVDTSTPKPKAGC